MNPVMSSKVDKRARAAQFRTRLNQAMERQGVSQSALARTIGVDRSTISQLLAGTGARLPNAQVVGECAAALGVSADWLLSLSSKFASLSSMSTASHALLFSVIVRPARCEPSPCVIPDSCSPAETEICDRPSAYVV
jgi:transcriptional regulator with XRE-family HTH domain